MWAELWPVLALLLAGAAAGCINALVGSGTLITFPALLALGVPPVSANMTSSVGIFAGNVTSVLGVRDQVRERRRELRWLAPASLAGGLAGALLLLVLPSSAFDAIVPALIALALLLVVAGPFITKHLVKNPHRHAVVVPMTLLALLVALAGVYGGYFGAAQGVLLMGLFGACTTFTPAMTLALKNVLATLVNLMSLVVFVGAAWHQIAWLPVLWIALGSAAGGWLGARYGQHLSPWALRAVILTVGGVALISLLTR